MICLLATLTSRGARFSLIALAFLLARSAGSNGFAAEPPTHEEMVRSSLAHEERVWRAVANDEIPDDLASRDLFAYALGLCEAKEHPERLERLFDVAARMQDREAKSPTYGNFRWSWRDKGVFDRNAVDFSLLCAVPLWLRHHEVLPEGAKSRLREILEFGVEGLLRHKVLDTYTNIALMNACNLILLGEALDKPVAAEEGYLRLDAACLSIWEAGVHEYVSPTYYGVDLDDLTILEAFCRRDSGRQQARALLELFWTDIALNWFPPAERLAGAQSRTYDFLQGFGYLDQQLMANGWLPTTEKRRVVAIETTLAKWRPPQRLQELSVSRFPRVVHQDWGSEPDQTRTHVLHRDVTLSVAGAGYGAWMDMPLTVDFPGPREAAAAAQGSVRCYFIADGRHDPYGKSKIQAGKAHEKALHLDPFFAGAQRQDDALGLAVYRDKDVPEDSATLESHFVMPRNVDACWIGEQRVWLAAGKPTEISLRSGEALVFRKGTAAVGVRIPWARRRDGTDAAVKLVDDANSYGAIRLTVAHRDGQKPGESKMPAGAAFWVRIGSGLATDEAFEKWRREFAAAKANVEADANHARVRVAGTDGPVLVAAAAPFDKTTALELRPRRAILELDGEDLGRKILQDIEPIKSYVRLVERARVPVAPDRGGYFEAEAGYVTPHMIVGDDPAASGGKFVWMPIEKVYAAGHDEPGSVTFTLQVSKSGDYYLWGRVLAPTAKSDSFFVRLATETDLVHDAVWATGLHQRWEWTRMNLHEAISSAALRLPAGEVRLQIRVREEGTKLDRLFITPAAKERPE